jgi:hypothetical protein
LFPGARVSRGATVRLAVTSDLHFDLGGHLTSPTEVELLVGRVVADRPDILVLAGDLGHGLANLRGCLQAFRNAAPVVAVLAGNHDLWRDEHEGLGSLDLFERVLPALCTELGAVWLEGTSVTLGPIAVAGTMAWYDYSGIDAAHARFTAEQIWQMKRHVNNDAHRIDWPHDDIAMARRLQGPFLEHLGALEGRSEIERVAVVSHVPLLDEQMARKPGNADWGFSNAYFGNLTLGAEVRRHAKVAAIVSGHTHLGRTGSLPRPGRSPLAYRVVPSDYGEPRHVLLEI